MKLEKDDLLMYKEQLQDCLKEADLEIPKYHKESKKSLVDDYKQ
jgi:hypothetical protein